MVAATGERRAVIPIVTVAGVWKHMTSGCNAQYSKSSAINYSSPHRSAFFFG